MRAVLLLQIGRTLARARLVRRGQVLWAGDAPFSTPEELEAAVCQLAAEELPRRPSTVRVELEQPLVQLRTLRGLPPVRASQLRSLVATQSGRFFRRNGKPLVTDACWPGPRERGEGTALAAAAEEPWLDAIIAGARSGGLAVERIAPANLPAGARLGLTPSAERRRRRARAILSLRRLAAVASVTWLAGGAAFVVRYRHERAALDREIARLEPATHAIGVARRALNDAVLMVETLDRATHDRNVVLARLTAVGTALPDSAFLTNLEVDTRGRGRLVAVARSSAGVLAALDRSEGVVSPRLEGSVVRETIADRDWERFTAVFGPEPAR